MLEEKTILLIVFFLVVSISFTYKKAVKIADALNTSVEFLVTGKSNNRKNDHSKTVKLLEQAIENLQKEMQ